jgi:GT2 family glycosyltransferase
MALVDVLIPTCDRTTGLAIVLAGLLGQRFIDFHVIVSDQSRREAPFESVEIRTLARALEWHGHQVTLLRNLPRRGLAEQRNFLLAHSTAPYVHFIDDDVVLEPGVIERMLGVLQAEGCAFVGCPATGLEYLQDERPHEQAYFEPWDGPVAPEPFTPDDLPFMRHKVNNAANPLHLERRFVSDGAPVRYKLAWVGGANILFDREKLLSVGGFSWWERLPPAHAGEEVVVQWLLIRRYGGCGILPAGTYHLGLPTNVTDRERNATELFADLLAEYCGEQQREVGE